MRYRPQFEWSSSWVYNLFRVYEVIFGRKVGPRAEGSIGISLVDGRVVVERRFFTLENFLVFLEGWLRNFFSLDWLKVEIKEVELATPHFAGIKLFPSISFAVAYDTSTDLGSGTTSLSVSVTVTGSNPYIHSSTYSAPGTSTPTETYNSVSLGQVGVTTQIAGGGFNDNYYSFFKLLNPATSAHTFAVSLTSGTLLQAIATSYSGVGSVENTPAVNIDAAADLTWSLNVTTVAANCLVAATANSTGHSLSAGSNTTLRQQIAGSVGASWDRGATVNAGTSVTLNFTQATSGRPWGGTIVSLAPPAVSNVDFLPPGPQPTNHYRPDIVNV